MGELRGVLAIRGATLISSPLENPGSGAESVRAALFAALQRLDPQEAVQAGPGASLSRLLELVRSCQPLPEEFVEFALQLAHNRESGDPEQLARVMSVWNQWLAANDLPRMVPDVEAMALPTASPRRPAPLGVEPAPFPRGWPELVLETRARLLDPVPRPPFSQWILPQPVWSTELADAFAVISPDEQAASAALIIVPSEAAQVSPLALEAWRARVLAGTRLCTNPVRARTGLISRILGCAVAATPSYIILERHTIGPSALADRLRTSDSPTPRQLVELAVALCDLLTTLAAGQVRIMDLRPELVAFEHSEGLRLTELLDPTAVWPLTGLVPELRSEGTPIDEMLSVANAANTAQVFLVAALVFGVLCNTTDVLRTPVFRPGRSSSFATLAGNPELADAEQDRIAAPLLAELRRAHPGTDDVDAAGQLVHALRWALSEEPSERHQSLAELAAALRSSQLPERPR